MNLGLEAVYSRNTFFRINFPSQSLYEVVAAVGAFIPYIAVDLAFD